MPQRGVAKGAGDSQTVPAMADHDLTAALTDFVTFAQGLKGDEKSEAPLYLNALFRAFGHEGTQQAGATHEHRVAKASGAKGKNYADLLWPERVLVEMKSRGQKLERHYDQVFDYWTHIVPHRPPYTILCNFDELWIYDFNQQLFDTGDGRRFLCDHEETIGLHLPRQSPE